jgi:hypothetical protein
MSGWEMAAWNEADLHTFATDLLNDWGILTGLGEKHD